MASLYPRGKYIWIKWYDRELHKPQYESTTYENTVEGWKQAEQLKTEIEAALTLNLNRHSFDILPSHGVTLQQAFDHYLRNNAGKDPKTIWEYTHFFQHFLSMQFSPSSPCAMLNKLSVENFLSNVKKFKLSQNTKYNICKNTKKFLGFLFEYKYASYFVINKDVLTRLQTREKIIFEGEDIRLIFRNLHTKTINFQTLIYMLFYSGRRPTDLIDLTVDRIDLKNQIFRFYSPKTDEWVKVPLHSKCIPVLQQRIKEKKEGKIFDYANIGAMGKAVRWYFRVLKINNKKYNLRTFRKTFVSIAHESYMDVSSESQLLGHSIATAHNNYRKLTIEKMRSELEKFQPEID